MAKNEFLPFGIADGANVLTNEEYGKLAARTNGFSSGVAKSQELNKVWRQASVIASVVAQFISETNDQDVLDDGNTTALRNGLLSALRATARTSLPNASTTTPGIVKLSSGINSDSELTAATSLAVKIAHEAGYWANKNADNRLEKRRNGGDIPNKSEFVKNLGLSKTVELAGNALSKSSNGADILNKSVFLNNIGAYPANDRIIHSANDTKIYNGNRSRYVLLSGTGYWSLRRGGDDSIIWQIHPDGNLEVGGVPVANGGTGATNPAAARVNLGVLSVDETNRNFATKTELSRKLDESAYSTLGCTIDEIWTGTHSSDRPLVLPREIAGHLVAIRHAGINEFSSVAFVPSRTRSTFLFRGGATTFFVDLDGKTLTDWIITPGRAITGIYILRGVDRS